MDSDEVARFFGTQCG